MKRQPLRIGLPVSLMLAGLSFFGCSSEKSVPSGPSGRVPLAEQPLPAATRPEMALENFLKTADFETTVGTLAADARKRWQELPGWVERCLQADWELDEQLDKLPWAKTGPRIPARAGLFYDLQQKEAFMPGRFALRLVETKGISDSEADLIAGYAANPPEQPDPPRFTFRALKEKDEWKLVPHPQFDPTVNLELLKHYTSAKEALIADVKAGKFKNRQEVLSAFSEALAWNKAAPGTPEAVMETYEARALAGDSEGILALLAPASHEKVVESLKFLSRSHESNRAYYEALEERFADQHMEASTARHWVGKAFDGSEFVAGYWLARHEVLATEMKGEQECRLTIQRTTQYGTSGVSKQTHWTLRKEDGKWKIDLPADDSRMQRFAEATLRLLAVTDALTARLKAGEFKSTKELYEARKKEYEKLDNRGPGLP